MPPSRSRKIPWRSKCACHNQALYCLSDLTVRDRNKHVVRANDDHKNAAALFCFHFSCLRFKRMTKSWCRWRMSCHPGDLPPLLAALLTQQLAPGLSNQTKRARSCSLNSSEQESAETRQKRVDASSTPKQPRLWELPTLCACRFRWKV